MGKKRVPNQRTITQRMCVPLYKALNGIAIDLFTEGLIGSATVNEAVNFLLRNAVDQGNISKLLYDKEKERKGPDFCTDFCKDCPHYLGDDNDKN